MSLHVLPAGVVSFPASDDSPSIASIRNSRVFTWDAEVSTTSQTVANQESSPADSSGQTDYDVQQGTSTGSDSRDPTYDSTNKFYKQPTSSSLDFLTMEGFKSTTTFTNSLHKDGAQFTIEMGYHQAGGTGGYIFSTAEDTDDIGIALQDFSNAKIHLTISRGTSGSFAVTKTSANAMPNASGLNHIIISIDEGVTNGSFYYMNDSKTDTFTLTYSSPSTSACTYNWTFLSSLLNGATGNPRFQVGQDNGLGYFAVYNKAVTEAEAAVLYDNAPSRYQV